MPKYCKAAHCFNYAGQLSADNRKLSFYKFPLHNKERLHQWLISMKREKMVPTKHQHLCSEHFTPSCFEWRWGVRYLKPDAVPTIFQHTGNRRKKKEISRSGVRKKFVFESSIACTSPEQTILVPSLSEKNLEAFTFAIDPCHTSLPFYIGTTQTSSKDYDVDQVSTPVVGTVNLIPVVQIVEPLKDSAATLSSTAETVSTPLQISHSVAKNPLDFPVALPLESGESYLAVESEEFTESASMSYECTAPAQNSECSTSFILKEASAAYDTNEINWPGALIIENVSIDPVSEVDPSTSTFTAVQMLTQMDEVSTVASPGKTGSLTLVTVLPETVLSSAITAPIVSTVPIVSNHANLSPGPGQCARQKASARLEESQLNILKEQLEEPMHLENSVPNEQLVAIALSLQKKVKLLQQRHRRHRSKIKSMERIVEGLRKENLISEEKLKILETACLQSNTDAPESVGAVAILCQEEARTLVYAMPQSQHEESESVLHLEEKQHIE